MHDKYSDLLQEYVDGRINPLEKILLEEHLPSCRLCRRELNQLKLLDWELKHQPAFEVPAELAARRMEAVNTYLAAVPTGQRDVTRKQLWQLQVQIVRHSTSFMSYNPVNRALNRSLKSTFSRVGRVAGAVLKKRNPTWARFIPGRV